MFKRPINVLSILDSKDDIRDESDNNEDICIESNFRGGLIITD